MLMGIMLMTEKQSFWGQAREFFARAGFCETNIEIARRAELTEKLSTRAISDKKGKLPILRDTADRIAKTLRGVSLDALEKLVRHDAIIYIDRRFQDRPVSLADERTDVAVAYRTPEGGKYFGLRDIPAMRDSFHQCTTGLTSSRLIEAYAASLDKPAAPVVTLQASYHLNSFANAGHYGSPSMPIATYSLEWENRVPRNLPQMTEPAPGVVRAVSARKPS